MRCHLCNRVKFQMSLTRVGICLDCEAELKLRNDRVGFDERRTLSLAALASWALTDKPPRQWKAAWRCG